jgi:Fur family iron response transcriptional regulator
MAHEENNTVQHILDEKGVRPTKIRRAIASLLFDGVDKHVSVDDVIDLARQASIKTSVASVYNTLNCFAEAGLLRRVPVDLGRIFFDTNLSDHHHLFFEDEGVLEDIDSTSIKITGLPELPDGRRIKAINLMVRT